MNEYERLVPEETRAIVDKCIEHARHLLEKDGQLAPVAFVGRFGGEMTVLGGLGNIGKDLAAKMMRKTARELDADFLLHVDEVWLYESKDKTREEVEALRAESPGRQVRYMPGRIDAVMFNLETHLGTFLANVPRETVDEAAKRYTFGTVEFAFMREGEGRFVGLLTPRGNAN
jgi:hypothetical protein